MELNPWKKLFYKHLRGRAEPLVAFPEGLLSSAALWAGARLWMDRWKGTEPIVLCELESGPEFLEVLVATLCSGGTFIAGHPEMGTGEVWKEWELWRPDFLIGSRATVRDVMAAHRISDSNPSPPFELFEANAHRDAVALEYRRRSKDDKVGAVESPPLASLLGQSKERRIVLRTSGTTGGGRWVALSDRSLYSVLRSHIPRLRLKGCRVLSYLPWNHTFGLVLDLIPALLRCRLLVRDRATGPERFLEVCQRFEIDYMNSVPGALLKLIGDPECLRTLRQFRGGLIGGAPITEELSAVLRGSQFRVGYGQSEASPGITLGKPGELEPGWLGKALGCEVKIENGTLHFRGPNLCTAIGSRAEGQGAELALRILEAGQWWDTGDIVELQGEGFRFLGRTDDNFKLSNGRFLNAAALEDKLNQIPDVGAAFVLPASGLMDVFLVCRPTIDQPVTSPSVDSLEDRVRHTLGGLEKYLRRIAIVPHESLPRTPKGTVQRSKLHEIAS
ncbi:MAG: acyl--CoA ligase [Leptospiraceae bacterium]|nr:acyl--CoA ligase [Leptospiraceae bacterium]